MVVDVSDAESSERAVVKTYVPRRQKEEWVEHADRLGMTQSEFVRCMVQAGRAEFEVPSEQPTAETASHPTAQSAEAESSDSDGEPDAIGSVNEGSASTASEAPELADRVVAILQSEGHCSWDGLVDRLTADLEDRLDDALQTLQQANRVQYSGRNGGYTVVDDGQ